MMIKYPALNRGEGVFCGRCNLYIRPPLKNTFLEIENVFNHYALSHDTLFRNKPGLDELTLWGFIDRVIIYD